MARLQPFRGWRYGADNNGPLEELITPPYDVISPTRRQEMAARNPYSFLHLVLPVGAGSNDRYQVAGRTFRQWRQEGGQVTAAGLKMPQKSTFFYPRVPAGLVIHTFD